MLLNNNKGIIRRRLFRWEWKSFLVGLLGLWWRGRRGWRGGILGSMCSRDLLKLKLIEIIHTSNPKYKPIN